MANVKKPYDEATMIISVTLARGQVEELDKNYENRSMVIRDALDEYFEKHGSRKTIENKIAKLDSQLEEIQNLKNMFMEKLNVFLAEDSKNEEYEKMRILPDYIKEIEKTSVMLANYTHSVGYDEKNMARMAKRLELQFRIPAKIIFGDLKEKASKNYLILREAILNADICKKNSIHLFYDEQENRVLISEPS